MYTQLVEILLLDMKTDMMPMSAHEPKGEKNIFLLLVEHASKESTNTDSSLYHWKTGKKRKDRKYVGGKWTIHPH